MRKMVLLLLPLLLPGFFAKAQKIQGGVGYNLYLAQGQMKDGFRAGHGIGVDALVRLKKLPFIRIGGDLTYSIYGCTSQKQHYTFTDGSTTTTNVNLTSAMYSVGPKARFELPGQKKVQPFAQLQLGGLGMYSGLYIEDPEDPGGCEPLDRKTLITDFNWYGGGSAGLKIDVGKKKRGENFLEASIGYITGGKFDYANMQKVHAHDPNSEPLAPKDVQPLTARFINISSGQIHEHKVAERFTHHLSLLQIQVKYVFLIGKEL